ncbi:class I SAM-dependent methyltransferase [candidate division KSB1 bacterium]
MKTVVDKKNVKSFFDTTFEKDSREKVSKFYSITGSSRKAYIDFLSGISENKNILEYGCGMGSYAYNFVKNFDHLTGIDISTKAVEMANSDLNPEEKEKVSFVVMDAEKLEFDDNTFDIVCGTGVLHYLDIETAFKEILRVLKPDGRAVFLEPLNYNPAINLYRKLTPGLRSRDEHPLTVKDLNLLLKFFRKTELKFFHLFTLAAIPFQNWIFFKPVLKTFSILDKILFSIIPYSRYLAWQVVFLLEQPDK